MDEQRRRAKGIGTRGFLGAALIIALVAVWAAWWMWDSSRETAAPSTPSRPESPQTDGRTGLPDAADRSSAAVDESDGRWARWLGRAPVWPADPWQPAGCDETDEMLFHLCGELSRRGGAAAGESPEQICGALAQAAELLASRPPKPTAELRSYETVISNVYHASRVLGRGRTRTLRDLLGENDDLAEPIAFTAYVWLAGRDACDPTGESAIGTVSMYDYGSFLFETIGGQAYLRRRSPKIEALVSFYSLLFIDRAVESGHNPHGVDPRDDIERARRLFDAQDLVFIDEYRSELEAMAARWERRSGTH